MSEVRSDSLWSERRWERYAPLAAMILARVSDDSEFSDEVLSETRAWLAAQDRRTPKADVRAKRKDARHTE